MKRFVIVVLNSVILQFFICSCDDRKVSIMKGEKLCSLEFRNESRAIIREIKVDVGDGQFSTRNIGVSASDVLVGFRMPKDAKLVKIAWCFDGDVFFTNSLALPEKWDAGPLPEIAITISERFSSVEMGR